MLKKFKKVERVQKAVIDGMLDELEARWAEAKRQRPTENAVNFGYMQDKRTKKWVMVVKLPSGSSFSCETEELRGLVLWLGAVADMVKNEQKDMFALVEVLRQFAIRCGDSEVKRIVEDSFGLETVGRPVV